MRRVFLALTLTGCQAFFPLEEPPGPSTCPLPPEPQCGVDGPDEDGDNLRDDCDPCPQSSSNADSDGDGIGDACDPFPAVKAACLSRRFFGMASPVGWFDVTGWSFDGDAFTKDPDLTNKTLTVLRSIDAFGTGRAESVIDDGLTRGSNSDSIVGIVTMRSADAGYFCGYTQRGPSDASALLARLTATDEQVIEEGTKNFSVTPGPSHRATLTTAAGGTVTCTIAELDNSTTETLTFLDPAPLTIGSIGVVLRSNDANFRYLDFVPD